MTRPATLSGTTLKQTTPLGSAYVTVNEDDGKPYEVFLNGVGKAGSDLTSFTEMTARLISLILQLDCKSTPEERLTKVAAQLSGIGGERSTGFGPNRVKSFSDGVAIALFSYLGNTPTVIEATPTNGGTLTEPPLGDICPECHNASLIFEEGCQHCAGCGYSAC